jgi:cytochrome b561/polyisoprenoid-binding protein YceI
VTEARYSKSAMALHWLIAGLMAFQYGLGEAFAHMPRGKALFDVAQFHKSVGITILLLTLLRLGVRFWKPRPAPHADQSWATWAAKLGHFGFYFVLIAVPLTGWLAASTSRLDIPTVLFNTITWPDFPFVKGMEKAARHGLHEWAEGAHELLSKLFLLLFVLHIVGALRHQFLLRETMIERMLPLRKLPPVAGSMLILALAAGAFGLMQLGEVPGIAPGATAAPAAIAPKAAAPKPVAKAEAPIEPEEAKEPEEKKAEETDPDAIPKGETPSWAKAPGGQLGFATSWSGSAINGSFGNWSADIRFNPDALPQSKIRITITLTSANSGDGERDTMLKGSDFFDTGSHPQATWTSSAIRHLGGNRYRADGTLTLRGVNKPVPISFTLDIKGKDARVSGTASLRRLAFGVGQGEFAGTGDLPDPVSIRFNFRARRP